MKKRNQYIERKVERAKSTGRNDVDAKATNRPSRDSLIKSADKLMREHSKALHWLKDK